MSYIPMKVIAILFCCCNVKRGKQAKLAHTVSHILSSCHSMKLGILLLHGHPWMKNCIPSQARPQHSLRLPLTFIDSPAGRDVTRGFSSVFPKNTTCEPGDCLIRSPVHQKLGPRFPTNEQW